MFCIPGSVLLGGFGKISDYDGISQGGFAYAELDLPEIVGLQETAFEAFCDHVQQSGCPVLVGARALPIAEPWFFTEQFSLSEYQEYMAQACERASHLGMKKIVLGNGKARWLINNHSIALEKNFLDLLSCFAELAEPKGIEIILEPLGPKYSNYINTLPQAARIIGQVKAKNLFMMADLRHLYGSGEPVEDIVEYIDLIRHIHIDYPKTFPERKFPQKNDGFSYSLFLSALLKAQYSGTLTIEADAPDDWKKAYQDAAEVLTCLFR